MVTSNFCPTKDLGGSAAGKLMALRASSVARTPLPPSASIPPPSKSVVIPSKVKANECKRNHQLRAGYPFSLPAAAVAPLFAFFSAPHEARAEFFPKEQIFTSLTQLDSALEQFKDFVSIFLDSAGEVIGSLTEAAKPSIETALPVLQRAGEASVKIASPVVSEASKRAQEAIQSSGFDTEPLVTAAKTIVDTAQQTTRIIDEAKPIASSTVETISSTQPSVILATGGDLTPAQTLDFLCTRNYVLVDIRSEKDKEKAGIPRLPSSAASKVISIPLEELPSKLKSLVRNVKKVEAELVALKISYLKKISKGSNIVILDSYSDSAKIVAKTLTKLGFKNSWIVTDGFSGGQGWLQSRLGTDSYNVSFAEVISPSRVFSPSSRRFGRSGTTKLLPGASE